MALHEAAIFCGGAGLPGMSGLLGAAENLPSLTQTQ